ncbi:uncharacterized protein FYW49_006386 [Xenentodon cancila]
MQHSQRLDQRLHMLRNEVRTMAQEKEQNEQVWRERLHRYQRQLKAKEDEMSRQSQYFENFKTQLHHKLSLAWDREQSLQHRIYTLEKQLLDMTVSAATGMATVRAVRITAGYGRHLDQQDRLPAMRGEGEGEEEKKEERRKQWQSSMSAEREESQAGEIGAEGVQNKDTKDTLNEARLRSFIISLQEDLRVLLEREEDGMTERRGLTEQLQEAQEKSHFLESKVQEMKAEMHQLRLSESSLMEEVEELREKNHRLQTIARDASIQTPPQALTNPESMCSSPGTSSPTCTFAFRCVPSDTTAMEEASAGSSVEIQPPADEAQVQPGSLAVLIADHQSAAENTQTDAGDFSSSTKPNIPPKQDPLNVVSKTNGNFQSLYFTTESLNEFKLGSLEESPSEESDALSKAFQCLGFGEDLQTLEEQHEHLEVTLQHPQQQLKVMAQENAQLKSELRKQEQQTVTKQWSSREKIITKFTHNGPDHLQYSPRDQSILALAEDDLIHALNQENRALADRIQELLAHTELKDKEIKMDQTQLMQQISRLEEEKQEQSCLISELTKKTEDDLNIIMELQQKLNKIQGPKKESQSPEHQCGAHWQREHSAATTSGSFLQNKLEEYKDSFIRSARKEEEAGFTQQIDNSNIASSPGCQHNKYDPLQSNSQDALAVNSVIDQMGQLTNSIHRLKTEHEELVGNIKSLTEQQREATLSVQTQTEEKQQLTRTIWALKEEKDFISQALIGLKQEKEQLGRVVCRLKDERDQFKRSTSGLKEEKEQLTKTLSALQRDKKAVIESLSSGKEERDQIMLSLQDLKTESDQLSQAVFHLKQQRDKLTNSLKCLAEQRDQGQLTHHVKEDHDISIMSVKSLNEGKIKHISCYKLEEKQNMQNILGVEEERHNPETLPIQTQTQEKNHKQEMLNPATSDKAKTLAGMGDQTAPRCETCIHRGTFNQDQSDLMREIKALGEELRKSQEDLEKSHLETKRLHSELSESEARRVEMERKAAHAAASQVMRQMTNADKQVEDIRKENDRLTIQVKELQQKVACLLREKTDALSLKAHTEDQYTILTAQLKAKTVALEELNSEYIALKQGQASRDDPSTVLVSLRARYNDIRAKYDALLKKKSLTDPDVAPLKAKVSSLVVKCQERNSLLLQMMKVMCRHGCVDPEINQQVEQLLSDVALKEYSAAFAPGSTTPTRDCCNGFTREFISKFQDCADGCIPDEINPAVSTSQSKQQNRSSPVSDLRCNGNEKSMLIFASESITNSQDCSEVKPAGAGTLKINSPGHTSLVQAQAGVQMSPAVSRKEMIFSTSKPSSGQVHSTSRLEEFGFHHLDMKEKSSSDLTNLKKSPHGPSPPFSSTRVGPSRRMSSPEKILNLHEQLQKTLMSSFQAPASRGREQQPRRSLSLSENPLRFSFPHTQSPPAASGPPKRTPTVTAKAATSNPTVTLFDAVESRSANVTLNPSVFTKRHLKTGVSKKCALSTSSSFPVTTVAPSRSVSGSDITITPSSNQTKRVTAVPDILDSACFTSVNSDVTTPRTAHMDITAPMLSTFHMTSKMNGAAPTLNSFTLTTSSTQTPHSSPERPKKSAKQSAAVLEKTLRPEPEAPAEVRSVEVIKTVGQSSLLIGWERPPLDELGCSNGTFVYGYRVFVDGDFHKSVMSSACTKCVLENIDLSLPVHIGVQTLGLNGLRSESVHTMYRTSG